MTPKETRWFMKKGKVGEIIYPFWNGSGGFFKKPLWEVVTKVDKNGKIIEIAICDDYATVRALEIMKKLQEEAKNKWVFVFFVGKELLNIVIFVLE